MNRASTTIVIGLATLSAAVEAQVGTSQVQKFEASMPAFLGRFGSAIARDGSLAAIGMPASSGVVEVWELGGPLWSFGQRITSTGGTIGESLGSSLDLDGDVLLIGAPHDSTFGSSSGAAYVFRRSAGTWLQEQQLLPFDMPSGFLYGVSVDVDGDQCVIGGLAQTIGNVPGVYVYQFDGTSWALEQKFAAAGAMAGNAFGRGVHLDGDTCYVGDFRNIFVFQRGPNGWTESDQLTPPGGGFIGADFAVDGDRLILSRPGGDTTSGDCIAFQRTASAWSPVQVFDSGAPTPNDNFGGSVDLWGEWLVVGATGSDWAHPANPLSNSGSAFLFRDTGGNWERVAELVQDDPLNNDYLGISVNVQQGSLLIGSWSPSDGGDLRGAVYAFDIASDLVGTSLCFGDGSGCTPCPCGNDAPLGTLAGCLNGEGRAARIVATGLPSATNDTLRFDLDGSTSSSFALLVSGVDLLPTTGPCPPGSGKPDALLDGLRCVGGSMLRHGARATHPAGATVTPWPGAIGLVAQAGLVPGATRHFQAFYRDLPSLVCGTARNTSQAISITAVP